MHLSGLPPGMTVTQVPMAAGARAAAQPQSRRNKDKAVSIAQLARMVTWALVQPVPTAEAAIFTERVVCSFLRRRKTTLIHHHDL